MKKNYFYALFASLMLFIAMPASAQMTSISDVYGKYDFKADVEIIDAAYANLIKSECEVTITKGDNGFAGKVIGFAGSEANITINSYDLAAGTICNLNPNTTPLWNGVSVTWIDGKYPYGTAAGGWSDQYSAIDFTFDAATQTLTYPDFAVVTCNHAEGSTVIVAKVTNITLTMTEKEEIIIPEIAGVWHYTPYYANNDSTLPTEFDMTLTAKDDTNTAWTAEFSFEGYEKFTLDATFDGTTLTIPFENLYLDEANGLYFGIAATSAAPENVFVKKGVIDFSYSKKTLMYQNEYIYIRQAGVEVDSAGVETPVAPIVQRLRGGWIVREDPDAYDWSGEYTLNVDEDGFMHFDESVEFASNKVIIKKGSTGDFEIAEILGYNFAQNNMSSLSIEAVDEKTANVKLESWGYPAMLKYLSDITTDYVYHVITGPNNGKSLTLELQEDGTIALSDFYIQIWEMSAGKYTKIALFSGATLVKNDTAIDSIVEDSNIIKGIFDIQGRQIDAITAPGLYIINGNKVLVK